jgi:hypothetical protein
MNSIVLSDNSLFLFSLGLLIGSVIGTTGVVIILLIGIFYIYRENIFNIVDQMILKPYLSKNTTYQTFFDYFKEITFSFFKK